MATPPHVLSQLPGSLTAQAGEADLTRGGTPTSAETSRAATLAAYRALGYNRAPQASRPSIRGRALTVERAVEQSSSLAQLSALSRESQTRLQSLQRVLPPLLWAQLSAGPIEGDTWCVLVSNNAVAAKIRQWVPAMAAHLRTRGWAVQTIRVKVRAR